MAHGPPTRGEARTCQPVVRRVGRVKCVAVFSARVWEREAFKADRADLDALASRGWHGGGAGGRRARLWDRSTALRPSARASMARTTDWTLTQRGIAQGRSLQGPAGHHDTRSANSRTSGPWARTPTPFGRRLVCHAPPRTQEGRPPRHPSKHKRLAGSFEHAHFPNEQGVAPARKKQTLANSARCSMRSLFLALSASGSSLSLRLPPASSASSKWGHARSAPCVPSLPPPEERTTQERAAQKRASPTMAMDVASPDPDVRRLSDGSFYNERLRASNVWEVACRQI